MAATARGRGICWCGCGKPTLLSKSTRLAKGHRIGVPQRYAPGCKPLLLARKLLNRHGIGHESAHAKKVPPRIFQVPDQQLARFLAVFWMCDGHVDRSPGLTLASEQMVRQVQYIRRSVSAFSPRGSVRPGAHSAARVPEPPWRRSSTLIRSGPPSGNRWKELLQERAAAAASSVIGLRRPRRRSGSRCALPGIQMDSAPGSHRICTSLATRGQGGAARPTSRLGSAGPVPVRPAFQPGHEHDLPGRVPGILCSAGVTSYDWIWSPDIFWDRITSITPAGEREVYGLQAEPNRNFVASGVIADCPVSP